MHLAKFVGTTAVSHWYQGNVSYGDNGRMQRPPRGVPVFCFLSSRQTSCEGRCDFSVRCVEKYVKKYVNYVLCVMTMTTHTLFFGKYWQLSRRVNHYTSQQKTIHGSRKNPPTHYPRFTFSSPNLHPHPRPGTGSATPMSPDIMKLVSRNVQN